MKKIKFFICCIILVSVFNLNLSKEAEAASTSFIWPTDGTLSSGFGYRWGKLHAGIDISGSGAIPIKASASGTVRTARSGCPNEGFYGSTCNGGLGNQIVVRHTINGITYDTVYGHMRSDLNVSVGQSVSQGQQLGIMGNSGSSTAQHLHFEIHPGGRVNSSSAVDPLPYLNGSKDIPLPGLPEDWHKGTLKDGQVGWIKINQPINLWKRVNGELVYERVLQPNDLYRVYSYDELYGGQYDVGGGYYITKMDTHIEYRNAYMEWRGIEFKRNQVGGLDILKPINLWKKDANGKLTLERILNAGEFYRVYGYSSDNGGQYDVGGGYWVTNMSGYITYSTPSKEFLDRANRRIY